jgi:hypothetical protein
MPTINNVAWDYANCAFTVNIVELVANEERLLVANLPIGPAVKEISYSGKIEVEDMMGSSRQSQDTTDGVGMYEASLVLEQYGADYIDETVAELEGHGIGTVRFNIGVTRYKTGIDPKTDIIYRARVLNPDSAWKAGKDPLTTSISLKPFRIYRRGKDLFGNKIV